jgi:hypothetical protein
MSIAGTNLPLITQPEGRDKISVTEKVTSPYFSNGETILAAANIRSSSLSDSNETYFFGISHKDSLATEEFNVAFGSLNGLTKQTQNLKLRLFIKNIQVYYLHLWK